MSDKNSGLIETLDRLKRALRTTEDAALAAELGMSKEALSNRKRRNSFPKEAIDNLIVSKGLSPDYVYDGLGSVFVEDEHGHTWEQGLAARLASELESVAIGWLQREGHAVKAVKAVAAGKQPPSLELLRDMRRYLKVDLNWLLTGEIIEAPSIVEEALLKLYRQANAETQQAVLSGLVVAAQKPKPKPKPPPLSELPGAAQRAGAKSVQISGSVSGGAVISTGDTHAAKAKRR
jgi:transcriptional regulator with XRE-family HTH domain